MARVALPLRFPDGMVRTLNAFKEAFSRFPTQVSILIAGGDLERFFFGIARDDLRDLVANARENGKAVNEIVRELAELLQIELLETCLDDGIIGADSPLNAVITCGALRLAFPRGRWQSNVPLTISAAKTISGAGDTASELSIAGLVIDHPGELTIQDIAFSKTNFEEARIIIQRGRVTFRRTRFDGVSIETEGQSSISVDDSSFSQVQVAMRQNGDSKIEYTDDCRFNKVTTIYSYNEPQNLYWLLSYT